MSFIHYENGIYYGQTQNNIPQGLGIFQWDIGSAYFGEWYAGLIQGEGIMQIPRVGVIKAQIKNNKLHGSAHFVWKNGFQMFANLLSGQLDGLVVQLNQDRVPQIFNFEKGIQISSSPVQEFQMLIENILSKTSTIDQIIERNFKQKNQQKFLGTLKLDNKCQFARYLGGIKDNKPYALGIQSSLLQKFFQDDQIDLQNLEFKSGSYKNGTFSGFVNYHKINGDVYTGFIQNHQMDGKGFYWIEEQKKWFEAVFSQGQCLNIEQTKNGNYEDYCLDICNFGLLIHSNDERLIKKKIQFLIGIIETSLNNKQAEQQIHQKERIVSIKKNLIQNNQIIVSQSTSEESSRSQSNYEQKKYKTNTIKPELPKAQVDRIKNQKQILENIKILEQPTKHKPLQEQYKNFLKLTQNPTNQNNILITQNKQKNGEILLIKNIQPTVSVKQITQDKQQFQDLQEKIYQRIIQTSTPPKFSEDQSKSLFNQDLSSILQIDRQSLQSNIFIQVENNQPKTPLNNKNITSNEFNEKVQIYNKENFQNEHIKVINMDQNLNTSGTIQNLSQQKENLRTSIHIQTANSPQCFQQLGFPAGRPYTPNTYKKQSFIASPVTIRRNFSPQSIVYPITPSRHQYVQSVVVNSPLVLVPQVNQQSPLFYSQLRRTYIR